MRLATSQHPWPAHPDEEEFVAALGFPRPYPVHAPGYALWVAAGTLASRLGASPYVSFQAISVAASCAAPVLLYLWLRQMTGDGLAWLTGAALGVNPVWWFEGVTALNYAASCTVSLVVAMLAWDGIERRSGQLVWLAAGILAVAIGLRADLLMWTGPLVVWAAWRISRPMGALVALGLAVSAAAWAIGVRHLYQGEGAPSVRHTLEVVWSTSTFSRGIIDGLLRNTSKLGAYLAWGLGIGGPVAAWAMLGIVRRPPLRTKVGRFVLVWIGPGLAFQMLIHITELGHAVWYLPAVYLVMGLAVSTISRRSVALGIMVALVAASIIQFSSYPWSSGVSGWRRVLNAKVAFASASGLRQIDQRGRIHRPNDFWNVPDSTGAANGGRPQR